MFEKLRKLTDKKTSGQETDIQMEVRISAELQQIYIKNHKNYDMALMTLLDSLDQEAYKKAFEIINPISLKGDVITIKIGGSALNQIKETFECEEVNNDFANLLLWIAVLFPEV